MDNDSSATMSADEGPHSHPDPHPPPPGLPTQPPPAPSPGRQPGPGDGPDPPRPPKPPMENFPPTGPSAGPPPSSVAMTTVSPAAPTDNKGSVSQSPGMRTMDLVKKGSSTPSVRDLIHSAIERNLANPSTGRLSHITHTVWYWCGIQQGSRETNLLMANHILYVSDYKVEALQ